MLLRQHAPYSLAQCMHVRRDSTGSRLRIQKPGTTRVKCPWQTIHTPVYVPRLAVVQWSRINRWVLRRTAWLQVYCDADFAFLPKLAPYLPLGRPVSVLDAGTNIGLAAILFAQLIKFNGEVMAVDANPGTLEVSCLANAMHACPTSVNHKIMAGTKYLDLHEPMHQHGRHERRGGGARKRMNTCSPHACTPCMQLRCR